VYWTPSRLGWEVIRVRARVRARVRVRVSLDTIKAGDGRSSSSAVD